MPDLPCSYVINLPRDTARRDVLAAQLEAAGVPYEFVEAVNGRALTPADMGFYDSRKRCRYFGRDLLAGELGCLLSHLRIFEKMDREKIPYAVILEDDVVLEPEYADVLRALLATDVPWDVIRFLGSEKIYSRGRRLIVPLTGKYWLARLPTAPGGAHGYLMTLKAARTMIKHMRRNWLPIDTLQGRMWETGLETLVTYPAPLHPDEKLGTTIGDARFDKTVRLTGWERRMYPLYRGWYKITDTLGKRYIYWGAFARDCRRKLSAQKTNSPKQASTL